MITLQAPRQGIARSPFVGYADVRNLDIDSVPGIAKLNTIAVKKSSTTVDQQPWWIVQDPVTSANFYALDNNGVVYNSTDSGATWSELSDRGGNGQGLAIWKGYLFVAETTTIDVYGPLSGGAAWTDNWATIDSDTLWHPMMEFKANGNLYGGAGRYVFSIIENSGKTFAPGDGTTYTFTQQHLTLPSGYRIKCLEELRNNLMIGTWKGTNVYDIRVGDIFPWDTNATWYGDPVVMDEYGVHAMINTGNSLVVLAGIEGAVYRSDGVNAWEIARLPTDLSGGKYLEYYPGSICNYKKKVFFGVGQGGTTAIPGMGVYSVFQTGRGTVLNFEHTISTLNDGTSNPLKPTALLPVTQDTLLIGWRDNATYGIDLTSATSYAYTTDYSGYFDSPIIDVGINENKWKPSQISFRFGRPLRTGEGIKIFYRFSEADTFTAIKTLAFADNGVGAIISKTFPIMIPDNVKQTDQVQFRVALLGTATTTPFFKSITIK